MDRKLIFGLYGRNCGSGRSVRIVIGTTTPWRFCRCAKVGETH